MGVYSGGRGGSSSDDSNSTDQPDEAQAGFDDFDESEDDEAAAAAAGAAGAVSAAGGASSGAGVAGIAGVTPVVEDVIEPGESEEECDVPETEEECEDEEECEEEAELEIELEEPEPDDSECDDEQDQEEQREEVEEPETETEDEGEDNEESDDEDDDDDEDNDVVVTIRTDPVSAMTWGIQPVLKRVQERYDIEVEYQLAPVRTIDDPDALRDQWEASTDYHEMPVDLSFWDNPPASTELLNRAVLAAERQGAGVTYLRLLWIRGIAGGESLSDERTVTDIADRLGLDTNQFRGDLEDVEVPEGTVPDELPVIEVPIKGYTQRWEGYVHYVDFQQQFVFEGMVEGQPQPLTSFVADHGPVTTEEVMETYQWNREHTVSKLQSLSSVSRVQLGRGAFWR